MKFLKLLWVTNIIFFIFVLFMMLFYPNIIKRNIVVIPNIESKNENEILEELNKLGLNVKIEDSSSLYYYTIPSEGMTIYQGEEVVLFRPSIDKDKYKCFINEIYDDNVIDYYKDLNIEVRIEYIESIKPKNTILSQDKANEEINSNDIIYLVLAKEYNYVEMPNLIGMDINLAIKRLNGLKLEYTIIYFESIFENDLVIYQEIEPGSLVYADNTSKIEIYVSKNYLY